MNQDSKIYVAGHKGLVGSSLVRKLEEAGHKNIIVRTHDELDLTRQYDTEQFFDQKRPEYVFLAAGKVGGILANSTYKAEFIYQNLIIAVNVINSSHKFGVKKLLNLGSSCVYPKLAPQPLKEEYLLTDSLEPTNEPYAIAKISAIKLCRYYNEQYGTNYISVMPTNLYGLNDNYNLFTAHVLPALIRKLHLAKLFRKEDFEGIKQDFKMHGIPSGIEIEDITSNNIVKTLNSLGIKRNHVTLWGSGAPFREFLYSDDLAEACVFLMQKYDAKEIGELINIGTGRDAQIKELANIIRKIVKYDGEVHWDTSKPDGTPKKLLDVQKMYKLGWKSRKSFKDGVSLTYSHYCKISGFESTIFL